MTDYYISILATTDDAFDEETPRPQPSVLVKEYEGRRAYLYTGTATAWPDSYIIGAWERDTGLQKGQSFDGQGNVTGTPTHALHADYFDFIRPLGNENGKATGQLDSLRWAGMPEQKYVEDDNRYPSDNQPFQLKIERVDHTDDPVNPGWGWKVTILSADPLRDITARGIGVYSDEEATQYLYTTGSFVLDGQDYITQCPVGQRTATPEPVYFALLYASAQEGFFSLPSGSDATEAFFWSKNQGEGGVDEWAAGVTYATDDVVTYQGTEYTCVQGHTSIPGWEPPNVPALWSEN